MRVVVVAVGKIKEAGLRALIDDYLKRVRRHTAIEEIELKDADEAEVAARITRAIPERARVVALEVEGRPYSSEELARYVGRAQGDAVPAIAFLIGGSYGLPKVISDKAHLALSLSKMTLPHRIARVVMAEQIYRAFTILRGEPYNH